MQELSLYGPVPSRRIPQVLRFLTGIAAMPPDRLITHHLIFKPKRPRPQPGTSQAELYYMQLYTEIKENEKDGEELTNGILPDEAAKKYVGSKKWVMKLCDIPEGGRRPVTSRLVTTSAVEKGDPLAFMDALGYTYVNAYVTSGHRLVHNNIVLTLTEVLTFPTAISPSHAPPPIQSPFPLDNLQKLDPNGGFLLHAYVRVQTGNDVESIATATTELTDFAKLVKSHVELSVGERLAMDTRVK